MHKYELYIPDRYIDYDKTIKFFDDSMIDNVISEIISNFNLTGVSIREELGYYKLKSGIISKMKNKVVYFFSESGYKSDLIKYCSDLKLQLRQESLLIICDGEVILC